MRYSSRELSEIETSSVLVLSRISSASAWFVLKTGGKKVKAIRGSKSTKEEYDTIRLSLVLETVLLMEKSPRFCLEKQL
jgi:hypothetical protein